MSLMPPTHPPIHTTTPHSQKADAKLVLKVGDECFFRPNMMFKAYDQAQDWPRGVVKEIRADGVVVIESWSWRLANGKGATVFSQWADVRRAPQRTKNQMLPEQRVWRAEEVPAATIARRPRMP